MTIEFFCPNDHQLSAPDHMAGKAGKCPRCGSKFLIPTLEELHADEEPAAPEPAPAAGSSKIGPAGGGGGKSSVGGAAPNASDIGAAIGAAIAASAGGTSKKSAWQGTPPAPAEKPAADKAATAKAPAAKPADEKAAAGKSAVASSDAPKGEAAAESRASGALPPGHFVFLCPNNHKLNGPKSLMGKPGQCPHCGAKFRIPAEDEEEELETASPVDSATSDGIVDEGLVDAQPVEDEIPSVEPISVWQLPPPPPGQGHRLAELFAWFWAQREQNSLIEIKLKDGETFVPRWFAPELSLEGFGVFATEDDLGEYVVSVLPWDSIQRLEVRHLADLPPQCE